MAVRDTSRKKKLKPIIKPNLNKRKLVNGKEFVYYESLNLS